MEQLSIGRFNISKIVESVGPTFELNFLLPEANPELLVEHRNWLYPHYIDPDSHILILSFHSYLVRTPRHTILMDACVGNDKERPAFPEMHRLNTDYLQKLGAAGVSPGEIDFVMCSHMHPDHVGWNTQLDNGQWVPTFPNARYLFGRMEYQAWEHYHNAIAGSDEDPIPEPVSHTLRMSFEDSVLPVIAAGRAEMIDDGFEVEQGITVESAPGHSPGNFVFNLVSDGNKALLAGDMLHHALQLLRPDWSSCFCSDPLVSVQTRNRILERIADTGTVFLPAHFPTPTWGTIESKDDGFRLHER